MGCGVEVGLAICLVLCSGQIMIGVFESFMRFHFSSSWSSSCSTLFLVSSLILSEVWTIWQFRCGTIAHTKHLELRAQNKAIENDMENRCFICGIERYTFDRQAEGFENHISKDHNLSLSVSRKVFSPTPTSSSERGSETVPLLLSALLSVARARFMTITVGHDQS